MHVLIQINGDGNRAVQLIEGGSIFVEDAIRQADDIIRKILAAVDYFGDVEYVPAGAPLEPTPPEGLVGVWLIDQESWELWELT